MKNYDDILWRNSGLTSKLGLGIGSVDARVTIMVIPLIFHLDMSSVYLLCGSVLFFGGLEVLGYTMPVAVLKARSMIAGKKRYTQKTISNRRRLIHG
jgi:hypothetical protein